MSSKPKRGKEVTREGKAQRLAEDMIVAALYIMGLRDRWIQKQVFSRITTSCERQFHFVIQLHSIQVEVECLVNGSEEGDGPELDTEGNDTKWEYAELEFENLPGASKFRGRVLPTGTIFIEPVKRILWKTSKHQCGDFQISADGKLFPINHSYNGAGRDEVYFGANLGEALVEFLENNGPNIGIELVQEDFDTITTISTGTPSFVMVTKKPS